MAKTIASVTTLEREGLSDDQLRAMLRNMLLQRQLDNRGFQLNRQGKIPFALGVIVNVLPDVTANAAVESWLKHSSLSAMPELCQITANLMPAILPPAAVQTMAAAFQR